MQANYQYILDRSAQIARDDNAIVLDYGCGAGEIVAAIRARGGQAFGVEIFYAGANSREVAQTRGLLDDAIREIGTDGRIPFDDNSFDFVVCNQVFEHIEDLDPVILEISRVLKPGGRFLCLFPTWGIIREVHCGVPIVHWLPKCTKLRYYWLLLFRTLGFGYHKEQKSRQQWAADFANWLRKYTYYRSRRSTRKILARAFDDYNSMEHDYVAFRLERKGLTSAARIVRLPIVGLLVREASRRYGGLIFVVRNRKSPSS